MKKTTLLIALPIVLFLTWLAFAAAPVTIKKDSPVFKNDSGKLQTLETNTTAKPLSEQSPNNPVQPAPSVAPIIQKVAWTKPAVVKGVYVTGWMAGSTKWFPRIVEFVDQTEVNSLVIDVKDDTGTLSYVSNIPLVNQINASEKKIRDPAKMFEVLKEHQIFPIARIVVFKDPYMAKQRPEWAVKDSNGGLWQDRKGLNWVDPYNKDYWDYIIDICKEAINMGFQEIQFDYVRFTSDGDIKRCVYPYNNGQIRADVIQEFLQYAGKKLKPYQIPISADIFGLTTTATDDLGIGQQFEKIAANVDIVSPMVYPSHYAPGSFGLKNPDLNPYETVFRSMKDARKRLEAANIKTTLRPWLQDFSLGNPYGRHQIQVQIKAANEAGAQEWIFWNPNCRYLLEKYR